MAFRNGSTEWLKDKTSPKKSVFLQVTKIRGRNFKHVEVIRYIEKDHPNLEDNLVKLFSKCSRLMLLNLQVEYTGKFLDVFSLPPLSYPNHHTCHNFWYRFPYAPAGCIHKCLGWCPHRRGWLHACRTRRDHLIRWKVRVNIGARKWVSFRTISRKVLKRRWNERVNRLGRKIPFTRTWKCGLNWLADWFWFTFQDFNTPVRWPSTVCAPRSHSLYHRLFHILCSRKLDW